MRRDGFATAVDELEVGLSAIAAPVRGPTGDVIAALSISGPTLRLTRARVAELAPDPRPGGAPPSRSASASTDPEREPHDARGDPAGALRRHARRQGARGEGQRRGGARAGHGAREHALRRAHPVAGGGGRALRARRLLRARDAHRRARDAGRAGHPAPAAGRHRRQPGRDLPHGHRQGRRPRHRQEPLQHHARGRRLHRRRPRRQRPAREVRRGDQARASPTSSASRPS